MKNFVLEDIYFRKFVRWGLVALLFFLNLTQAASHEHNEKNPRMQVTVTGTVIDHAGEPLPGVTVSVAGTTIGTATDLSGNYSLTVPEGATLVFSFIGFESRSIPIGDRSVIDVVLVEDVQSLEEVVVVGYGTQRKSDVTGSVVSVNSEDFVKGVAT